MHANRGNSRKIARMKTIPESKSTQLAKFLNIPQLALIIKIIPKKIKILVGASLVPNRRINPAIKSIPPRILINIFFKSCFYLKILSNCLGSSVWIRAIPSYDTKFQFRGVSKKGIGRRFKSCPGHF